MARGLCIVGALVLTAGVVLADSDEVVTLHDGSKFRGELVEQVPNDHVTLKLATGEIRKFAWADIEKSEEIATTNSASPAKGVHVNLNAQPPAELQRRTGSISVSPLGNASLWEGCTAPCDKVLPAGTYRVAGPHLRPTPLFDLPDHGSVRVDAKLGSMKGFIGGIVLASTGGLFLVSGAILGAAGAIFAGTSVNGVSFSNLGVIYEVLGGVFGGIGLVTLIPGIVMLASNTSHTAVVQLAHLTTTGLRF